ncbi:MAG: NAD-dependent epimerase/dehydratase family protein [Veillonellaceae bacterium]|jgi:UDP-glucose 4-epimerase|nr:NAD-dependent epimerase/dehydratase family protein [Veillonellaceae bacterium]
MKLLVTGGAGFIGSHIVDKLIETNHQVVIVDDLSLGVKENLNPGAQFIEMDIRCRSLNDLIEQEKFDIVIHQAAQTMVSTSIENPFLDCNINITGTVNLLEACRKNCVKRIIYSSSAAVYGGENSLPIKETASLNPTSFYGLSKLTVEKYFELYHKFFGLQYIILRYANVYGERQAASDAGGVISIFTRKVQNGEKVYINGDGSQTRDFIYVGDVAWANIQALLTPYVNRVYNISTQTETSLNTLFDLIAKISGRTVERQYLSPRAGDIYRSSLLNKSARKYLCWYPTTTLTDGLTRTYNFFKSRRIDKDTLQGYK